MRCISRESAVKSKVTEIVIGTIESESSQKRNLHGKVV